MNPERNPADLYPLLRTKWEAGAKLFKQRHADKPQPFLSQCFRSEATQKAYFAQGRQPLTVVNALRLVVGLGALTAKQNYKVTWSLFGQSPHNYKPAMAFDVLFPDPAHPGALAPDALQARLLTLFAACMIEVDPQDVIEWGGEWPKPKTDRPHFQIRGWEKLIRK